MKIPARQCPHYPQTAGIYKIKIYDSDFLSAEIYDENDEVICRWSLEGVKENTASLGYKYILPERKDLVTDSYEILYSSVSSSVEILHQSNPKVFSPYENITDGVALIIFR